MAVALLVCCWFAAEAGEDASERAQRRHVGEREGVHDDVLCEESREVAHVGFSVKFQFVHRIAISYARIVHTMRAILGGEGEGRRSSQTAKAPCWLFGCFSVVSKVSHHAPRGLLRTKRNTESCRQRTRRQRTLENQLMAFYITRSTLGKRKSEI